jgi:hypothetical protein
MELFEHYVVGVPADKREQALVSVLKGFWFQHRDRLDVLADKENPLRDDALSDLSEWKLLGESVIEAGVLSTSSQGYMYANRLASLNVPTALATFRYAKRSKKVDSLFNPK